MYAALWRILPGPIWLKIIILLVLVSAVVAALIVWVFPVVDRFVEPQEVTVQ